MDIRKISPLFSVTSQITPEDVNLAAAQGFKTIISNRPDGEADDQPETQAIASSAERAGLGWHYFPVISGHITEQNVEQFYRLLKSIQGPVLAFCRTGTRSATLWGLVQARHPDIDAIHATTRGNDEADV